MALWPFTFINDENLPHVDYGAAVKLKISYTDEVCLAYLTLSSITASSYDIVF